MPISAIIDCDPGHDDVMAILYGARTLDLRAITTTFGNASLNSTTKNACQTVEFAGLSSIPIAAGSARPLVRLPQYASNVHGATGLDGPNLPPAEVVPHSDHAVDLLLAISRKVPDLYLLPIGPLTNIACALLKDSTLQHRIKGISLMGGSLTFGNITQFAEFNIYCDPEAAHVVFTSGIPIKMVGINVTHQVLALPKYRAAIRGMGTITSNHVADMLDFYSERETVLTGLAGGSMHDPLAVAALVAPDVLSFEPMHVAIELAGNLTAGMTVCEGRHLGADSRALKPRMRGEAPNAEVAVAVNAPRFWELFLDTLSTYP